MLVELDGHTLKRITFCCKAMGDMFKMNDIIIMEQGEIYQAIIKSQNGRNHRIYFCPTCGERTKIQDNKTGELST